MHLHILGICGTFMGGIAALARAAAVTAPTPVTTAQPTVASASNGTSAGTGTAPSWGITACCAKHAVPRKCATS